MKKICKKKSYKAPIIKRIKLDPEQAILQQCAVSGAYFGWMAPGNLCLGPGTGSPPPTNVCYSTIRGTGVSFATPTFNGSTDAQPS